MLKKNQLVSCWNMRKVQIANFVCVLILIFTTEIVVFPYFLLYMIATDVTINKRHNFLCGYILIFLFFIRKNEWFLHAKQFIDRNSMMKQLVTKMIIRHLKLLSSAIKRRQKCNCSQSLISAHIFFAQWVFL